jgi:hypothetical protein
MEPTSTMEADEGNGSGLGKPSQGGPREMVRNALLALSFSMLLFVFYSFTAVFGGPLQEEQLSIPEIDYQPSFRYATIEHGSNQLERSTTRKPNNLNIEPRHRAHRHRRVFERPRVARGLRNGKNRIEDRFWRDSTFKVMKGTNDASNVDGGAGYAGDSSADHGGLIISGGRINGGATSGQITMTATGPLRRQHLGLEAPVQKTTNPSADPALLSGLLPTEYDGLKSTVSRPLSTDGDERPPRYHTAIATGTTGKPSTNPSLTPSDPPATFGDGVHNIFDHSNVNGEWPPGATTITSRPSVSVSHETVQRPATSSTSRPTEDISSSPTFDLYTMPPTGLPTELSSEVPSLGPSRGFASVLAAFLSSGIDTTPTSSPSSTPTKLDTGSIVPLESAPLQGAANRTTSSAPSTSESSEEDHSNVSVSPSPPLHHVTSLTPSVSRNVGLPDESKSEWQLSSSLASTIPSQVHSSLSTSQESSFLNRASDWPTPTPNPSFDANVVQGAHPEARATQSASIGLGDGATSSPTYATTAVVSNDFDQAAYVGLLTAAGSTNEPSHSRGHFPSSDLDKESTLSATNGLVDTTGSTHEPTFVESEPLSSLETAYSESEDPTSSPTRNRRRRRRRRQRPTGSTGGDHTERPSLHPSHVPYPAAGQTFAPIQTPTMLVPTSSIAPSGTGNQASVHHSSFWKPGLAATATFTYEPTFFPESELPASPEPTPPSESAPGSTKAPSP